MKTKPGATLNTRKTIVKSRVKLSWTFILLLISIPLIFNSCTKNDDLAPIQNELPIDNNVPMDDEIPLDIIFPLGDPSITDNLSVIVYTDIEPDFNSENGIEFFNLDLNNDGIADYTLEINRYANYVGFSIQSYFYNKFIAIAPWYTYSVPLQENSIIFNLDGYHHGEYYDYIGFFSVNECFGGGSTCFHDWQGKTGYLGLRFRINGNTHYGWARMEVTSHTQWVVYDYAYNATPNKPILAGQK